MTQNGEKRQAHRAPIGTKVSWTIDHREWYQDESQNVSSSGMMIRTQRPVEPGASIELNFKLPNFKLQDPIEVEAEVVRVVRQQGRQIGLGMRFLTFHSHSYGVLREFVCRIMGLPLDDVMADLGTHSEDGFSFEMERLAQEVEAKKARLEEQRMVQAAALQRKERVKTWAGIAVKTGLVLLGILIVSKGVGYVMDLVAQVRAVMP